jgi:ATP-dependent 26S proteasome regulatory subunit
MSGAEITLVCREAGLKALTEDSNIEKLSIEDIKVSLRHI